MFGFTKNLKQPYIYRNRFLGEHSCLNDEETTNEYCLIPKAVTIYHGIGWSKTYKGNSQLTPIGEACESLRGDGYFPLPICGFPQPILLICEFQNGQHLMSRRLYFGGRLIACLTDVWQIMREKPHENESIPSYYKELINSRKRAGLEIYKELFESIGREPLWQSLDLETPEDNLMHPILPEMNTFFDILSNESFSFELQEEWRCTDWGEYLAIL